MWIIPKNISDTYPSVVDTKELGLDSEEFSAKSERYLMWRSKPSQSPTWLRRWKRIKYLQHLSGRILKHSHTKNFLEKWTSSLGDSPANLFPMQEAEKELKTQDTSIPTSVMESEDVDQDLFSWKMLKESSVPKQKQDEVFCSMSSKTWKEWVTSQRQEYSQRVKLAHLTKENESSSWPTASARDHKGGYQGGRIRNGKVSMDTLDVAVQAHTKGGLLDQKNPNTTGKNQESWGTPSASDHKGHPGKNSKQARITKQVSNPNKLNPNWVEQLMGLPVGWTDLGSWETESSPKQ